MKLMKKVSRKTANTSSISAYARAVHISALLNSQRAANKCEDLDIQETEGNAYQRLVKLKAFYSKRRGNAIDRTELRSLQMQIAVLSDEDGDRPIHVAVANENFKLVQKLCVLMLRCSIPLDITNYLRQTALHLAVMLGNAEITQLLLNCGASPVVCDRNGNSVLHLAVKSGAEREKEVLQILLSYPEVRSILNTMDYEGYSPLHYAVFRSNYDAVKLLHETGADINKIDGKSGRTALIHSVLDQNIDMTILLLNCGASPQKSDYSGRTSFDMALQIAKIPLIKLLEKSMPGNDSLSAKEQIEPVLKSHPDKVPKKSQRT